MFHVHSTSVVISGRREAESKKYNLPLICHPDIRGHEAPHHHQTAKREGQNQPCYRFPNRHASGKIRPCWSHAAPARGNSVRIVHGASLRRLGDVTWERYQVGHLLGQEALQVRHNACVLRVVDEVLLLARVVAHVVQEQVVSGGGRSENDRCRPQNDRCRPQNDRCRL